MPAPLPNALASPHTLRGATADGGGPLLSGTEGTAEATEGEEWKHPGPGRPSWFEDRSPIVIQAVRAGMTQARAADLADLGESTVSEWKGLHPKFAQALRRAEAEYLQDRMEAVKKCETKWGTPDPKALELELRRFPEFRQHQVTESTSTTIQLTLDPSQVAQLQGLWAASREKLASAREAITVLT